ncbi:hypothetical protein QL993_30425, partial [Bacillus wiedmannii]|nr:hypothetical protein [Bacillus wiedmannii]
MYIIISVVLILLATIYFLFNTSLKKSPNVSPTPSKEHIKEEKQREQQANTVSYGLKDKNGQHIDNGSEIVSENNNV